jgi:two-component system OmpR family response regulator
VLVVEDDAVIADHITACLGTLGYRPERVASGEDALAAVERQRFSGMVLDRLLPGMGGIEVLARLRADRRLPPVVMLSALGTVKDRIEASPPAPTTIWPSRSTWTNWWPASTP